MAVKRASRSSPPFGFPLAFVDVETTGLSPAGGDRVCEIGILRLDANGQVEEWAQLVNPQRPISPGAFAVNRITAEMLMDAPDFNGVIPVIERMSRDAVIVAHNAPFDLGFICSEYVRAGFVWSDRPVLDTAVMARRHFSFASNRLGALAREFGVRTRDAHRALADCRTTHGVFLRMIEEIFDGRIPSLMELQSILAPPVVRPAAASEVLPASLAAMLEQSDEINITYIDGGGEQTLRNIRVIGVEQWKSGAVLLAHCHLRDGKRHFRLDRIVDWGPATSTGGAEHVAMTERPADCTVIRVLTQAELALLVPLWEAAGLWCRPCGRDSLEALTQQWIRDSQGFLGAFDGEQLVGTVLVTDDGRRGWINRLAVHPDYVNRGIGSRLVAAGEALLHGRGLSILAALIDSDNESSQNLFKHLGYEHLPGIMYYSKRDSPEA